MSGGRSRAGVSFVHVPNQRPVLHLLCLHLQPEMSNNVQKYDKQVRHST